MMKDHYEPELLKFPKNLLHVELTARRFPEMFRPQDRLAQYTDDQIAGAIMEHKVLASSKICADAFDQIIDVIQPLAKSNRDVVYKLVELLSTATSDDAVNLIRVSISSFVADTKAKRMTEASK